MHLSRKITAVAFGAAIITAFGVSVARMVPASDAVNASAIEVVDGDTIRVHGEAMRLRGWDAPETRKGQFKCVGERRKGRDATAHLEAVIDRAGAIRVVSDGSVDIYDRALVTLLVDGEDAGALLAAHGLAKPTDGPRHDWCTFIHGQ